MRQTVAMGRPAYTDVETLSMFVLRARRIAAHSLMGGKAEDVRALAGSNFNVNFGLGAEASFSTPLPPEEERFESLAARVRPLILPSEPVHYGKVLAALGRSLYEAHTGVERMRADLETLSQRWARIDPEPGGLQAWSIWTQRADGTGPQHEATDSVMALGWLYSDLVHVELRQDRAVAAEFPMSQRYVAAAQVLSRVALTTLDTLAFTEALVSAKVLPLPEALWEEEVVAPESLQESGLLYVGDPGQEIANPKSVLLDGSFSLATLTTMARREGRRADIVFLDAQREELSRLEGAIIGSDVDADARVLLVLIEDSLRLDIYLETSESGQALGSALANAEDVAETNRALRAHYVHMVQASRADEMILAIEEVGAFKIATQEMPPGVIAFASAMVCLLDDLVRIEEICGETLPMPRVKTLSESDLTEARRARLLMEGAILESDSTRLQVPVQEAPPIDVPVVLPESRLSPAGVPLPPLRLVFFTHAGTTVRPVEEAEDAGTGWWIETSDGKPFLLASFDHAVSEDDQEIIGPLADLGLDELFRELKDATREHVVRKAEE